MEKYKEYKDNPSYENYPLYVKYKNAEHKHELYTYYLKDHIEYLESVKNHEHAWEEFLKEQEILNKEMEENNGEE